MHTKKTFNHTTSPFLYLCLGINLPAILFATINFWEKPALATTNQENYLSEINLTTDNSKYTVSSVNPDLKLAVRKITEREKEQLLKPVDLSSELLVGEVEAKQEKLAESPDFCCQNITKSSKIAQTDSSEVIGDTLGEANKIRQELLIDPITVETITDGGAAPGSTAGTPSAYGASWGQAYVGGGLFFPLDKGRTDGSLSVGFGLGDTVKSVGVEVNANITSVGGGNSNFDFGDSGSLGFKVHKYLGNGAAVAVGFSNPITWGDSNKAKDTIYGVATKSFNLQPNDPDNKMPLTISLGVGSGSFRSKGAIEAGDNPANIFGSIGIRTAPEVAWVSSWTGNRLNIGGSFAPFKQTPIVINAIFTDVTNNFGDGLGISLSAGYAIRF
ncbi:hypothetical protein IQ247_26375 [Plectonema cf. radiosum LEGE 06105]|uniref:Uncharacterized protein n=1 Tax=Plectonema cf. radiosum LEGE 06105 TaxID=945769 RepID=A0A8J7FEQ6_9CYAN|nr:hypothetical protein [Plectonema radiosum]MBE9216144.1 hypothetical protein [Plectonema cf. radiosum LEGE 06105]